MEDNKYIDLQQELLKQRIIILGSEIDDAVANYIVAAMLYLEAQDPDADIYLYINSPGGSVSAGMGIYDTMQYIKPDVATICFGSAASMAATLLTAGAPGKRFSLPNTEIMIHQPMGGVGGQATDIEIHAREISRVKRMLIQIYADTTHQEPKKIRKDMERDNFMTPKAALEYGLIDKILTKGSELNE